MKNKAYAAAVIAIAVIPFILVSVTVAASSADETKKTTGEMSSVEPDTTAVDDAVAEKEAADKAWLQKARVLGWARRYPEAMKEYRALVDKTNDPLFRLEMEGKRAYWNDRVYTAICKYKELIQKDPENVEAMFDLSQIYSYQSMWPEAIGEYNKILAVDKNHFRATEGLEKARLISQHVAWETGYDYIEADSQSRDMDIRKHTIFNRFTGYVRPNIIMEGLYNFGPRSFSDFADVIENEGRIAVTYVSDPAGWASAYYDLIVYNQTIDPMNTFGGALGARIADNATLAFMYDRQRLQNSSNVIRWHEYEDDCKVRADYSVNTHLKLGADYTYAHYSDRNYRNEPGFDILYFFSLDPLRLSVQYRYFYRAFWYTSPNYWSPKEFMTNELFFNWRHYLNKEEIFFGADDLYYDLGYNVSVDSETIAGHTFSGRLHWDINKRFSLDIKGYFTKSSNKVYKDEGLTGTVKYYF